MKKFIYRVFALFWLITHPREDMYFPLNKKGNRYAFHPKDGDIKLLDFIEILDYVVEDQLIESNWWEPITSWEQDPSPTPWFLNERNPYLAAKRDLDYPIDTMSPHHRSWRKCIIESKGFVRD